MTVTKRSSPATRPDEELAMLYIIDAGMTFAINSISQHSGLVDKFMLLVSAFGVPAMVLAVAVQWWARSNRPTMRHLALTAGFSFALALAVNQVILLFVQRVRPYDVGVTRLLGPPSIDASFPSDHATAAFAIAFAFLMLGRNRQGFALAVAATLISFSRVYVGTHYVSDILGGAVVALATVWLVTALFRQDSIVNQKLAALF